MRIRERRRGSHQKRCRWELNRNLLRQCRPYLGWLLCAVDYFSDPGKLYYLVSDKHGSQKLVVDLVFLDTDMDTDMTNMMKTPCPCQGPQISSQPVKFIQYFVIFLCFPPFFTRTRWSARMGIYYSLFYLHLLASSLIVLSLPLTPLLSQCI